MAGQSIHSAVTFRLREQLYLWLTCTVVPDMYLYSAMEFSQLYASAATRSGTSPTNLIPSYLVSAQMAATRSNEGPAIIFKADDIERPFSHFGI
jgi:hypothetical protein